MNDLFLTEITPLRLYILVTFIFFLKNYTKINYKEYLFFIILFSILNEIALIYFKNLKLNIGLNTTIYCFINYILWFLILFKVNKLKSNFKRTVLLLFLSFAIFNMLFIESILKFNFNTFTLGAIIYVSLFIYLIINELKKENLIFFLSNEFVLIFTPVIFFLGFSLLFSFKDKELLYVKILKEITLFKFISHFVNIIYYSLINIYIYKERKLNLKNA